MQVINLQRMARAALATGDLDIAVEKAQAALALDPSKLTMPAREVLFNVALLRGELSWAAVELSRFEALPELPPSNQAWLARSSTRLRGEIAEGWADVATAREAMTALQVVVDLPEAEQAWLVRMAWRLDIRAPEQILDLGAMESALNTAHGRADLTSEDTRWLEGAHQRLTVLEAESTCALDEARASIKRMGANTALREADRRWADLMAQRLELRALDAANRDGAALMQLNALLAQVDLPAPTRAWAQGYQNRLALKAALAHGDAAEVARLRPAYQEWAVWEPMCARLHVPDEVVPDPNQQEPGPWVRVGALGGVQGWRVVPTQDALPQDAQLATGDVLAAAAGLSAAVVWPLWRGLGPRGELSLAPALEPVGVGSNEPTGGRWDLHGALGVVWTHAPWEVFAGASLDRARFSGAAAGEVTGGYFREVLPSLGGALVTPVGPGTIRLELAGGGLPTAFAATGVLAYMYGDGAIRPMVALEGNLTGARNTWEWGTTANGSEPVTTTSPWEGQQLDIAGDMLVGVEWRPAW